MTALRLARLDVLKVLVGGDRGGGAEDGGGDTGADDVDPVEGGLGGDLLLVAAPGEPAWADVEDEVLGDLPLVDDLAGPDPDLAGVFQPPGPTDLRILSRSASVSASSSARVRARPAASTGLWQQISRLPG
jgi:hypothetical protein